MKCAGTDSDEPYLKSEITQNSEVQGWSSDWPQVFIIKNTTEYQENTGLFVVQKTEICLWRPLLSYSDVPHSGHLRLLLFSHFTLQRPEPHLSQRREGLSGSSILICTFSSSFSLSFCLFFLWVVYYIEKYFKKALPLTKAVIIIYFASPSSLKRAG